MATVELELSPVAANVRTARLIASTIGRRSGLEESLIDEVKLAVGEACARAVGVHRRHGLAADVVVTFVDGDGTFTVTVTDAAPADDEVVALHDLADVAGDTSAGEGAGLEELPPGFGLAVVSGLVEDVEVSAADPGTAVRMRWPLKA